MYVKLLRKTCYNFDMKKIWSLLFLGLLLPSTALAHVKWFVDAESVEQQSSGLNSFYGLTDAMVIVWFVIIAISIIIFSIIDRYVKEPQALVKFGQENKKIINRVSQAILGLFLISVSFLWKIIIIPELPVDNTLTTVLQFVQVAVGCLYVFNIKPKLASIGLVLLVLIATLSNGIVTIFENAILISLAVYFYIINSKEDSKIFPLNDFSIDILRIGTGISLVVLAFTEKLLHPELSLQFLYVHHWNFMQPLFPWFSNSLFILSTACAEIIFGLLFIFGYLTRVTTILIAVFFGLSVITMLFQFHAWEVEDLVVYSAAILFIFYGNGKSKLLQR